MYWNTCPLNRVHFYFNEVSFIQAKSKCDDSTDPLIHHRAQIMNNHVETTMSYRDHHRPGFSHSSLSYSEQLTGIIFGQAFRQPQTNRQLSISSRVADKWRIQIPRTVFTSVSRSLSLSSHREDLFQVDMETSHGCRLLINTVEVSLISTPPHNDLIQVPI